ncbi:MAG: DNA primase [Bacteroidetes bacterium CG12_big_fil_rev_8_21_14_0_65_60_17]|nr:MAG: DNA primase [Bacteroidetes bacterium CG12_big_fil_rev_8_21_14_0_65_60_17]
MSRISDTHIEEVRTLTDIVDVVSDYVRLKKRGNNFIGLCPFHSEKTPSFNVNPGMGIFKCFGCGEGGDVFHFLERVEGLSFPETVRLLAEQVGVQLPEEDGLDEDTSEREAGYHALRFAARFYHDNLTKSDDGSVARAYLKERGFDAQSIRKFGVGYAPDSWDALLRAAETKNIGPDILAYAGLVVPRKERNGWYDRYRHRLMFPIFSHVGKVLGFGGRILRDEDTPKYINSPETKIYSKSRVLYGLYHGKNAMRHREEAVLVEGYTDVVSLYQAGVQHVVASSGTALTGEQVALLGRYVKTVVLLYDADAAGDRAALRAIDLILAAGLVPYAVQLPDGEDPDSFVRSRGGPAFDAYLRDHRQDFVAFMLAEAGKSGKMDTPEGRAAIQRAVLETLAKINDPLVRESYLRVAAGRMGLPDMQLRPLLEGIMKKRRSKDAHPASPARKSTVETPQNAGTVAPDEEALPAVDPAPPEKFLHFLMLDGGLPIIEYVMGHLAVDEFTSGPSRELAGELVRQYVSGAFDRERILGGAAGEGVRRLAAEVLTHLSEPSMNWERRQGISVPKLSDGPLEAAGSAMVLLRLKHVNRKLDRLQKELYRAQQTGAEMSHLLKEQAELLAWRRAIENREFLSTT